MLQVLPTYPVIPSSSSMPLLTSSYLRQACVMTVTLIHHILYICNSFRLIFVHLPLHLLTSFPTLTPCSLVISLFPNLLYCRFFVGCTFGSWIISWCWISCVFFYFTVCPFPPIVEYLNIIDNSVGMCRYYNARRYILVGA